MLESSYPPEVETDEEMSGTIGHALDRIVRETSRAPVFNKKLIFPRESVRVSELEEKQKELERAKKELEAARQKEADDKIADPTEFKDLDLPLEEEVVDSKARTSVPVSQNKASPKVQPTVVVPQSKPVAEVKPAVQQEAPKPQVRQQPLPSQNQKPAQVKSVPKQPVAQSPKTTVAPTPAPQPASSPNKVLVEPTPTTPVQEPAISIKEAPRPEVTPAPTREVVAYRRQAPARRRVVREVKSTSDIVQTKASDEDLEIFMKEAEKVESREIQCRADVQQLLNEIAERTGCSPEDLASQAVAGVAVAIKNAGFQFDLPMKVKSVRR